jgi:hypothetical protein
VVRVLPIGMLLACPRLVTFVLYGFGGCYYFKFCISFPSYLLLTQFMFTPLAHPLSPFFSPPTGSCPSYRPNCGKCPSYRRPFCLTQAQDLPTGTYMRTMLLFCCLATGSCTSSLGWAPLFKHVLYVLLLLASLALVQMLPATNTKWQSLPPSKYQDNVRQPPHFPCRALQPPKGQHSLQPDVVMCWGRY